MARYLPDVYFHRYYEKLHRPREDRRPYSAFGTTCHNLLGERRVLPHRNYFDKFDHYNDNSKLHQELQRAKLEIDALERKISRMEIRTSCLKNVHKIRVDDLEFDLSHARGENRSLKNTVDALERELEENQWTIKDMKRELLGQKEREEKIKQLQRKADQQSRTISSLDRKVSQQMENMNWLKNFYEVKVENFQRELCRAKEEHSILRDTFEVRRLKVENDELKRKVRSLEHFVDEDKSRANAKEYKITTLEREVDKLKDCREKLYGLNDEKEKLKDEVKKLKMAEKRNITRIAELSEKLDTKREATHVPYWKQHVKGDFKKTEHEDLGQHLPVTDDIKSEIWKKDDEIRGLKRDMQREKRALEAAKEEIRKLHEKLEKTQTAEKELQKEAFIKGKQLSEESKELLQENEKCLKEANEKIKDLQTQLKTQNLTNESRKREDDLDVSHKIEELERKLSRTRTENDQLTRQIDEVQRQNKNHVRRVTGLEKENTEYKSRHDDALRNLKRKESEAEDLIGNLRVLKIEKQDLQKKIDGFEKVAAADKRSAKESERIKNDYKIKNEEAEWNLKQKERDCNVLKRTNEALESEIKELKMTVEKLGKDTTKREEDLDIRDNIKELEERLFQTRNENEQLLKHLEESLRENESQIRRVNALEKENTEFKSRRDDALWNLKRKESKVEELVGRERVLKLENQDLQKKIERIEKTSDEANTRAADFEKKEREVRLDYQKAEASLKEYEKDIKQLKREKADAVKRVEDLGDQVQQHQEWSQAELAKKEDEIFSLRDNIKKLSSEKLRIMNDRDEMEKAKDDALTRLSKAAGAKLTQGNAAITDLSDDNRPTKIAEKFSELYDNLWTDAYEELSDQGLEDLGVIDLLLQILKDAYQKCMQKEKMYDSTITEAVHSMPTMKDGVSDRTSGSGSSTIPTNVQIRKAIVDIKLALGPSAGSKIAELYMPHLEESLRGSIATFRCSSFPKTAEYGRQCAILCWLMRIRDPSVHIDFSFTTNTRFDGDFYRQYTKSGSRADYLVWPILYLHEGGPLLAKGVAQPK